MTRIIYNEGLIIEIVVREGNGRKIETQRCNGTDSKSYGKILKYLKSKYDIKPMVEKELFDVDSEFWKY